MKRSDALKTFLFYPLALFCFSLLLRVWLFSGFVLCDDLEEFALTQHILANGASFEGHLQYRVPMWIFNALTMSALGYSELSFFLPTVLFSASLAVIGYLCMLAGGYSRNKSALAGAIVASAPFEVLIGTVRANDVILEWFLAASVLAFVRFAGRPRMQGVAIAVGLFLGFYTKLWAVYLLPVIGVYYIVEWLRSRQWQGFAAFVLTSAALYGGAAGFWRFKLGTWAPFLQAYSATYPVARGDLVRVLKQYPTHVFVGSEVGSTLFGYLPYFLLVLLGFKYWSVRRGARGGGTVSWDLLDATLIGYYACFFLFLNFFTNSFRFDQYYSAPRIFRYLAPLSFPMALHTAKLVIDLRGPLLHGQRLSRAALVLAVVMIVGVNVSQAVEATAPGRLYRRDLLAVVDSLRSSCPPRVLVDAWPAFFLREAYLKPFCPLTAVLSAPEAVQAGDYEAWLARELPTLPEGTVLVTGLASCVHYACTDCGFRLRRFSAPLDSRWVLMQEFETLTYLPDPEPVRLWRLEAKDAPGVRRSDDGRNAPPVNFADRFKAGMELFNGGNYDGARRSFAPIIESKIQSQFSEDARYFTAVTHWRQDNFAGAISDFTLLLAEFPKGHWSAGAYYHIGMAQQRLGRTDEARQSFNRVLSDYPEDQPLCALARERLAELPAASFWRRMFGR